MMSNDDDKIIPFPRLKQTLTEKGTFALQNEQYKEALETFNQLLSIDPKHAQANLGKAICLVELGDMQEAATICEMMLNEAIGDYFEVLQVYVSILIQLEQYQEVVDLLEAVVAEEKLPASLAEFFYQLLTFCRKMVDSKKDTRIILSSEEVQQFNDFLHSEKLEKQMLAVEKLTRNLNNEALQVLKTYLKIDKNDPILKSIIIRNLAEEKIDDLIEVHKFSERMFMNPTEVEDPFEHPVTIRVTETLSEVIENENPTLYELSIQLWTNVVLIYYPYPLPAYDPRVIAAVIHFESSKLNGLPTTEEEICSLYEVQSQQMKNCKSDIATVNPHSFPTFRT